MNDQNESGKPCPKNGIWEQAITGEKTYFEKGDIFPYLHEIRGHLSNAPVKSDVGTRVHYKLIE